MQHVIESKVRADRPRGLLKMALLAWATCPRPTTGERSMANSLLPPEERNLTPDQVEALDKRRDLGHTLLVIAGQFTVIAVILLLWVGQDLAWSPGWAHPIGYYFAFAMTAIVVCAGLGSWQNRGTPRID
jgi:hypothetical protein